MRILPYMARKQVGSIDSDLLDRVDVARGDVPRTRFVERALEAALGGVAQQAEHSVVSREVAGSSPAVPVRASASFKCPRDCRKSFRPGSPNNRCPVCRKPVVPA